MPGDSFGGASTGNGNTILVIFVSDQRQQEEIAKSNPRQAATAVARTT